MAVYRTLPFVQTHIRKQLHPQAFVIDATLGNGNDTLTIAKLLTRSGKVFGFDIQNLALEQTQAKLQTEQLHCSIRLFHASHANMLTYLHDYVTKIDCVIFNLGYLPHADKTLTTTIQTTYTAILQAMILLKPKGLLIIVTYPGHENGRLESEQLTTLFQQANPDYYYITTYQQVNNNKYPPQVFLLEKRK